MSTSVLIVGAGPTGLVLALSLLQNGVSVRIIEKETSYRVGERGAGMMPRTIEVHNILGTIDDVLKKAHTIPKHRIYEPPHGIKPLFDRDMSPYVEPTPQIPYSNLLALGQNHLEAILRSHVRKYGVEVELGTSLQKFDQDGDFVIAHLLKTTGNTPVPESVKVSWLVGADGAHSIVRKELKLSFLGERPSGNAIVGDIFVKGGLDREFWHFWGDVKTKMVSLRPSGQDHDIFNFLLVGTEMDYDVTASGRDELIAAMQEISGRKDIIFGDLIWMNVYRPNVRMVDRFHVGRVFIAGDAAHCHTPAGGQGMNSSVQDAFNLGWKLALVEKGLAPGTLLDSYDEERLPVIADMLKKTTAILKKTLESKSEKEGESSWRRDGELHMLGVNYRSSSIVLDGDTLERSVGAAYNHESERAARAGDRAPDAPGLVEATTSKGETSLFQLFKSALHTLLVFGGLPEDHKQLLSMVGKLPSGVIKTVLIISKDDKPQTSFEGFDLVVIDSKGFARDGYHITGDQVKFVAVRPDGVVGARVGNVANIRKYFSKIFN